MSDFTDTYIDSVDFYPDESEFTTQCTNDCIDCLTGGAVECRETLWSNNNGDYQITRTVYDDYGVSHLSIKNGQHPYINFKYVIENVDNVYFDFLQNNHVNFLSNLPHNHIYKQFLTEYHLQRLKQITLIVINKVLDQHYNNSIELKFK